MGVGRGSPAWSVVWDGPPIEALVGFFLIFISGYEMETVGLKICGGCRGFQDFLAWVIDLGHGFLWVGFSVSVDSN